jgi:hypothetical protein
LNINIAKSNNAKGEHDSNALLASNSATASAAANQTQAAPSGLNNHPVRNPERVKMIAAESSSEVEASIAKCVDGLHALLLEASKPMSNSPLTGNQYRAISAIFEMQKKTLEEIRTVQRSIYELSSETGS